MLVMTSGLALTVVPAASATATPFVWTGSSSEPDWSFGTNWEGGSAPSSSEPVTLEFPRIPGCSSTCYTSEDNLSGVNAESIKLDNGDEYELRGKKEIMLGGGGLTASPAGGTSGPSGDVIDLPVQLGASQTWSIAGRSGGGLGENGALVLGSLTGSSSTALTFEISNEAALILGNETEVGPATITGADTSEAGIFNGFVDYLGELNFLDDEPVSLSHIFFVGSGAVGALSTNHAELDVGSGADPAEGIVADSATFDSASEISFQITGPGSTAGKDYSQLESIGAVELGGSTLRVHVSPPEEGSPCPSLHAGQKYTFIAASGKLSGSFANAPEGGPEIPISFARSCGQSSQPMRISYHTGSGTETVTGTVEAAAKETEEREERERREAREHKEAEEAETRRRQEAAAAKKSEEEALAAAAAKRRQEEEAASAATKKRQEEEAAAGPAATKRQAEEAAANRRHVEEATAKNGILAAKEESKPKPPTRAQRLAKALKACRRQAKRKRTQCEAIARKRYGSKRGTRSHRTS